MHATVKAPRRIIDRRHLADAIGGIVAAAPEPADLRRRALAEFKAALQAGRAEARRRFEAGEATGRETAAALCFLIDQIIRSAYDLTVGHVYPATNPTAAERISLVALGGYGRGELAPGSDVDLLFLFPYKSTPWHEQVVEFMLYLLWDLGLKVGHSTRTVSQSIRLSRQDITIRTSLLEMRWLWGEQLLFLDLKDRFSCEVMIGTGAAFVAAKLKERDDRHARMGDTRYVVEPNLKEGKGGLRDLHTLWWIAKYSHRVDDAQELVNLGVLSPDEYRRFTKAENFLWDVRCHLHFLTGRPEERLTFDVQPEIARRCGYADRPGSAGVERFMKHYFLTAKDVGDLTRIFCANLEDQTRKPARRTAIRRKPKLVEGFLVEGARLDVAEEGQFAAAPIDMLRLFDVADRAGLDIHPHALQLITRSLKLIDAKLRADPAANALFMEMLTARRDPETVFRRMNEAGVLGRFIPDFGRVVAQMQYDMYHVYTVDEHTIRAIGNVARIGKGALSNEIPPATRLSFGPESRRILYVSTMIHDIAKGRGGDHSELGAEIADRLCPRLGMSPAETQSVSWLVRFHLLMSNTAFKRDLTDPKTVQDFARLVQNPERLKLLFLLTVADIKAVGPNVWNAWKGQLLRQLYHETEPLLSGGHVNVARADRIAGLHRLLRERLTGWSEAEVEAHLRRLSESYLLSTDENLLAPQARLMREADEAHRPLTVVPEVEEAKGATRITVYTLDHPGLFARIAGAMALSGASILDAKIFTTHDGMALDSFTVQDAEGCPFDRPERLARLVGTIEQVLAGRIRPREVFAKAPEPPRRNRGFKVAPRVVIDNAASERLTVVEVVGLDRPGLLSELTRVFFARNITIRSAHIATYGERVVDVFYVSDLIGHKIRNGSRLRALEQRLLDVLDPARRAEAADPAARPAALRAAG